MDASKYMSSPFCEKRPRLMEIPHDEDKIQLQRTIPISILYSLPMILHRKRNKMEKWSTRLFKLTSLFAVFLTGTSVSLLNFSKKKKKR